MPEAFVGLPSLLIYIGILAMAFTGFNGGPSVFL
jgi:Na+-translocating ferredoxin:NAD+ oxidoreductase RnfA subunit